MNKLAGYTVLLLTICGSASALVPSVPAPEIDGSSFATGVALAAGAFLVIRARNRR